MTIMQTAKTKGRPFIILSPGIMIRNGGHWWSKPSLINGFTSSLYPDPALLRSPMTKPDTKMKIKNENTDYWLSIRSSPLSSTEKPKQVNYSMSNF
ncbi:hypothetical protein GZ78_05420 [Endozoicomonas numazuensis]|uniref:Uncharacterized protein n=1 Tax=Endozoicomonas numazuensis TaxID=1137799 RepID=A0A081NLS2_9GAMM|nr:hypothetical protein GZ78_05420 [Endozoicomonas numazuensis]